MQRKNNIAWRWGLCIAAMILFLQVGYAQEDTTEKSIHFNGNISVTNNGFSLVPTFSLGKPATVAEVSIGGGKFSFEPQFRFDLDGLKPWSLIFIWRYKWIDTKKFEFKTGMHLPAYSYQLESVMINGSMQDRLVPSRWLALEFIPTYKLTQNVHLGVYYLLGNGLEKEGQTKRAHFVSFRAGIHQIRVSDKLFFKWYPQFYYLNMDGTDGVFFAQTIGLAHREWPVSIATMMNKKIESEIVVDDFDWNISLIYSFKNEFKKKKG